MIYLSTLQNDQQKHHHKDRLAANGVLSSNMLIIKDKPERISFYHLAVCAISVINSTFTCNKDPYNLQSEQQM